MLTICHPEPVYFVNRRLRGLNVNVTGRKEMLNRVQHDTFCSAEMLKSRIQASKRVQHDLF